MSLARHILVGRAGFWNQFTLRGLGFLAGLDAHLAGRVTDGVAVSAEPAEGGDEVARVNRWTLGRRAEVNEVQGALKWNAIRRMAFDASGWHALAVQVRGHVRVTAGDLVARPGGLGGVDEFGWRTRLLLG